MLNANIPLAGRGLDVAGSISNGNTINNQLFNLKQKKAEAPVRNRLLELGATRQEQQIEEADRSVEFDSVLEGTLGLEAIIGESPLTTETQGRALEFLTARKNQIIQRGGNPDSTNDAINLITSGDNAGVRSGINRVKSVALQTGRLSQPKAEPLFTSTVKTEDGGLLGVNRNTGATAPIDTGGASLASSSPTVNINNEAEGKGLTEEQKALAKSRVRRLEALQNSALDAVAENEQLQILKDIDVNTGFGEAYKVGAARIFNALGVDGEALLDVNVANAQSFNAVAGTLLAQSLAKQKGPQTDQDASRMEKTLANLSNETLANDFILNSTRAINARKIEQAEFYENILEGNGTLKSADKEWAKFKRETPMLSATAVDLETGLPMFFNEFQAKVLERTPQATQEQIINAWRDVQ